MLSVVSPEEVFEIINSSFKQIEAAEELPLLDAVGRIASEDIKSEEYIPGFDRSAMDGYAVKASDTFGCSDSIPAILKIKGAVQMGQCLDLEIEKGTCYYVPTGGAIPKGADSVVMIEYTEDYGDGTVGILKPAASGSNYVFKGDDVKPGQVIIHKGKRLSSAEIGSLASLGISKVKVYKKIRVGIISTGDELVDVSETPKPGQIRNINSTTLSAIAKEAGADYIDYGIVKDDEKLITDILLKAASECDLVLMSGGSSAGDKDNAAKIIEAQGELLFHGIAVKPGKPTMLGIVNAKPVFGIAGHPGGAYFIANVFVRAMIEKLSGTKGQSVQRLALLSEAVSSNHGRAQYIAVKLRTEDGLTYADPIISKSGLITNLAEADGYVYIERDCEGMEKNTLVEVTYVL